MSAVVTLNPAIGERLAEYSAFSDADVDAALDGAATAQVGWAALPFPERSDPRAPRPGREPSGRLEGSRAGRRSPPTPTW